VKSQGDTIRQAKLPIFPRNDDARHLLAGSA
jgi:hypothetical protein